MLKRAAAALDLRNTLQGVLLHIHYSMNAPWRTLSIYLNDRSDRSGQVIRCSR